VLILNLTYSHVSLGGGYELAFARRRSEPMIKNSRVKTFEIFATALVRFLTETLLTN